METPCLEKTQRKKGFDKLNVGFNCPLSWAVLCLKTTEKECWHPLYGGTTGISWSSRWHGRTGLKRGWRDAKKETWAYHRGHQGSPYSLLTFISRPSRSSNCSWGPLKKWVLISEFDRRLDKSMIRGRINICSYTFPYTRCRQRVGKKYLKILSFPWKIWRSPKKNHLLHIFT